MHVQVSHPEAAANAKWRGAALAEFDGKRWFNRRNDGRQVRVENGRIVLADYRERPGTHVSYRVSLNAVDTDTLFFAGDPEVLEIRHPLLVRTRDDSLRLAHWMPQRLRYQVYAFLEDPQMATLRQDAGPAPPPEVLSRYLQLPRLDPRIAELARAMTAAENGDGARARAIQTRLHRDYGYTLELPSQSHDDPLAHFLFERRKGHCEYFASAMAVMLRSLGIPARIVTGFQSGVWNPYTEMYVIRASDAHSWVEAWLPGRGWAVFDPTPPEHVRAVASFWSNLALWTDTAETFWREWVLGYDLGRQAILADNMQQSGRSLGGHWFERLRGLPARWKAAGGETLRDYGPGAGALAVCLGLAVWLGPRGLRLARVRLRVARARLGQASEADATLLYLRMLELLARRGHQKPGWFTPREFASSLPPELRLHVAQFTEAYNALRFGADPQAAPQLSELLDRIEGKQA
jgi:protein-glutamine gamma-glutamyltransferase